MLGDKGRTTVIVGEPSVARRWIVEELELKLDDREGAALALIAIGREWIGLAYSEETPTTEKGIMDKVVKEGIAVVSRLVALIASDSLSTPAILEEGRQLLVHFGNRRGKQRR